MSAVALLALCLSGAATVHAPPGDEAAAARQPADLTPKRLLQRFQAIDGLFARYREEKRMALLAAPLVAEGTLHYARPGRLARHQRSPSRSSVVIVGDDLRFGDEHGTQNIDLEQRPVVRMFIDSFLQVLAGDHRTLVKAYAVEFKAEGERWIMNLRPKQSPMSRVITGIELRGRGVVLEQMTIREQNGDVTETVFSDVDTGRTYSRREIQRIFRVRQR